MITIKHYNENGYHWTVTEVDQDHTYLRHTYAMGWDEPNYPMPALIDERDPEYYYLLASTYEMRNKINRLRIETAEMQRELSRLNNQSVSN